VLPLALHHSYYFQRRSSIPRAICLSWGWYFCFVQPQRPWVIVALCCRTFWSVNPPWALQMRCNALLNALERSARNGRGLFRFRLLTVSVAHNAGKRRCLSIAEIPSIHAGLRGFFF